MCSQDDDAYWALQRPRKTRVIAVDTLLCREIGKVSATLPVSRPPTCVNCDNGEANYRSTDQSIVLAVHACTEKVRHRTRIVAKNSDREKET